MVRKNRGVVSQFYENRASENRPVSRLSTPALEGRNQGQFIPSANHCQRNPWGPDLNFYSPYAREDPEFFGALKGAFA